MGGLITKMGLRTGGPLIPAAEDNEKGFFERVDVVIQNDLLLARQGINYALFTNRYNALEGLKVVMANRESGKFFAEGRRGLAFLNNKINYPWMLKDPRLCITLRTWLPLLNFVPAILFIYRHPFDVSLSMNKRATEHFKIERAMKLWYMYNKRAIQQSDDLCLVVGSHKKIMKSPHSEFARMYHELNACGVDVPRQLTSKDIESFIDVRLQHGKNGLGDVSCGTNFHNLELPGKPYFCSALTLSFLLLIFIFIFYHVLLHITHVQSTFFIIYNLLIYHSLFFLLFMSSLSTTRILYCNGTSYIPTLPCSTLSCPTTSYALLLNVQPFS